MKKIIIITLVMVILSTTAMFGIDLSAGGGIVISPLFAKTEVLGVNIRTTTTGFGFKGFLDATYVETSVSGIFYSGNSTLMISALGKYPIDLNSVTLFPLAGLSLTTVDSKFWINAGLGVDYDLSQDLYIRGTGVFGLGAIKTSAEKLLDDLGLPFSQNRLDIGISVGYRF